MMPYNRHLHFPAPLPSGALPTNDELAALARHARRARTAVWRSLFGRLLHDPARLPHGGRRRNHGHGAPCASGS